MSTSSLPSSASQSIRPSDSQEKQMKIMVKWLSLFKFSWLRKCKVCRVRGTKCLCKRPSLALEHIFFLEERKNKFGARNFSHVSDTMVTTTSSTVMSANNTVLMRGSSFGDEYAFADYYYNPSQGNSMTQQSQTQQQQRQSLTSSHSSRGSLDKKKKRASPTSNSTTAIVRKNSGKMVPTNTRRRFEELPNEYMLYSEARSGASACVATSSSSLTGSSRRRPLRLQSGSSSSSSSAARKEENGVSFKFYGRGGKSSSLATTPSTFNSSRGLGSKNDSLILSASSSSALRISTSSDRMSVDNNFGSYNPRGMFIDNGYASSIQEDDDDDALQQLNGWLQASPSSTAGSFAAPRNIHCF